MLHTEEWDEADEEVLGRLLVPRAHNLESVPADISRNL